MTAGEVMKIQGVIDALETVKVVSEMICQRDSILLSTDRALKFMLSEVESQNTPIAADLAKNWAKRIGFRRNGVLVGLLSYLEHVHDGADSQNDDIFDELFQVPSKKSMLALADRE